MTLQHVIRIYYLRMEPSTGYDEVDDLLFHIYLERSYGRIHQTSVDADESPFCFFHDDFRCSEGVHAFMVKDFPNEEQIESFDKLRHLRVVDHRDIEQHRAVRYRAQHWV